MRIIIAKLLTDVTESGLAVVKLLKHYNITDTQRQLIVVMEDMQTLPGTIALQTGSDLRGTDKNRGNKNIIEKLGHSNYIRHF